ncbi:FtsB family cell division protein [Arthrobacter mobilis]|uniref:Septum formation initiator family protein n=1 Tax=Arthrobacter mobilis TaxID=2724944 RepID=A0A7X6HA12_9MICC|nr:septum formation initiator family protein [Arthrobacter mobilis]NKX53232.1 septum formation initiator family protein [Arthrobacter mobilis]
MTTRRPRVPRAARPAGDSGPAGDAMDGQSAGGQVPNRQAPAAGPARATGGAAEGSRPAARILRPEFSRRRSTPGPKPEPPAAKPTPAQARAAERSELARGIRRPHGPAPREKTGPEHSAPADRETAGQAVEPVPAKAFSGRMLALAVVLITITVLLAPSVRVFIEQRSAIAQLQDEIAQEQAEQAQLKKEIARWDDPAYIKQQARDRIFYVMPGETRYMVTGAEGLSESKEHASRSAPSDLPWVDALWDSVKRSATDEPGRDDAAD